MKLALRPAIHPFCGQLQIKSSAMHPLLSSLLLSCCFVLVTGIEQQHLGMECTSSCGGIQIITFPFRLESDPAHCGLPDYQLLCDGDKTLLDLNPGKYYVTGISYGDDPSLHVVDASLAAGSNCSLPLRSLSSYVRGGSRRYRYSVNKWASFVNCTRMIENDAYWPVPCLSRNNAFVYVIVSEFANEVRFLEPFCGSLASIPIDDFPPRNSSSEVFQLIQKGSTLYPFVYGSWSRSKIIHYCLRDAKSSFLNHFRSNQILSLVSLIVKSELHFLRCVNDYAYRTSTFWIALVVTILIMIAQFLILSALLGRCVCAPLAVYLFLAYQFWSRQASIGTIEKFLRNQQALALTRYAYTDIIAITNHFKEKLGQGGFGSVFKGGLPGGHLVAVKMLGNSRCNGEEFINEVSTIGRIHHVNIVRLVGFCSEGSKRALVYEYMPNRSLDKYIFSSNGNKRPPFTWDELHGIALGVARGIHYLHQGCDMQILHFDIKPYNILLDQNLTPKISDFGLAKLYPKDHSLVSISVARGTIGYIAPELISRNFGVVSSKSDVYSFGMLLLEMASGRRNADPRAENSSQDYYPSWIYDRLTHREALEIGESPPDIGEAESKLSKVGLWCIQMKSSNRPSMSKVIEMLEGDMESLQMPPRPFFSSPQPSIAGLSCMNSPSTGLSIISEHEHD